MRIAVIGSGNLGRRVGGIWAHKGHLVVFGSRDPGGRRLRELTAAIGHGAKAASLSEAAAGAELVFLAVPWEALKEAVGALGDLSGRILVDSTNPLAPGFDHLDTGAYPCAAAAVAAWAPGARIVKAFNTVSAVSLDDPLYGGVPGDHLICGDDPAAKAVVRRLAEECGHTVLDAGPLKHAVHLESLAMLWMLLAYQQRLGPEIGIKLLKR